MGKKILVVYYSQSGQLKEILENILAPVISEGVSVEYLQLKPVPDFPFPWSVRQFFQAMPESVLGIPCQIEPMRFNEEAYDLIIFGYQSWYLSPSIPAHAFFQSPEVRSILPGSKIVTVQGCRNMWVMAQEQIKDYILDSGGVLVGNIVLRDRHSNLLSVLSILRWLTKGKKKKTGRFVPDAGVSDEDMKNAYVFSRPIIESIQKNDFRNMQSDLLNAGAVKVIPHILMMEKTAKRIFRIWAKKIIKKGGYGSPERDRILAVFKYYLLAVIFVISPIAAAVFYLTWPFRFLSVRKQISRYSQIS